MISTLTLKDTAIRRGGRLLFEGVSLALEAGQACALTGPNGSGKTSLLRAVAGFVRLEAGLLSDSVRTISDVGPSYVLCAALVAAILYGHGRIRRLLAFAAWVALLPFLFEGLPSLEVAAVGHLVAMISGALIGGVLLLRERGRATGATPVADAIGAAEARAAQAVHGVQDSLKPGPAPSEA